MFPLWPWMARFPWSGDVMQDIAPLTNWFSPQVELNFAGDRQIESDVVSNVASYGKQLGILSEAVVALAKDSDDPRVQRLRALAERIEDRKRLRREDLLSSAEAALRRLAENDPAALEGLLAAYRRNVTVLPEAEGRSAA